MRLSYRIAVTASIMTAAVTVVIGSMSYFTSRSQIIENAKRALDYEASIAAENIGGRLATITETFANLSANTVVFNALIDSAGRETYLMPFFQGFTTINDVPISVSLVDFQAQVVAETAIAIGSAEQEAWLLRAIDNGRSVAAIFQERGGRSLILAEMLLYPRTNTVEGVLIFKLPLESLLAPGLAGSNAERMIELTHKPRDASALGDPAPAKEATGFKPDTQYLTVSQDLPVTPLLAELGLAVEVSRDDRTLGETLRGLFLTHMAIALVAILIVLWLGLWAGQRLTRPLRQMEALATSIVDSESFGNRFEVSGSDEINQVGSAFNHMLERLSEAYGKLKSSASRLTTLVHSLPDSVFILDQHGRQIAVLTESDQPQPRQATGPLQGIEPATALPESEVLLATIRQALESGSTQVVEYERNVPGTGAKQCFEGRVTPLPKDFGPIPAVMWIARDATDAKRSEEALRQAQKMEAVGQLTGGVAHDFNNLLAIIMGNAEIVEHRQKAHGASAKAIIRAASRGAQLTQRLLAFSRQQPLRPHAVDLDALIGGMTELLERTLGEPVVIKTATSPGTWKALADPGQVENALLNLAINARDAMSPGGILAIETANATLADEAEARRYDVLPGDYVALSVRDNGAGMPPEVLTHVFEPFFTTKESGQGSGLGLSMVYGFAKQSGGCVTIESKEGEGTAVTLYLPRAEKAAEQVRSEGQEDVPAASGETILVVEDDPDVRQLAVTVLKDLGYFVLQASDGESARGILKTASSIELLLSDVVLPGGMSGPALAQEAKDQHGGIKVLFMSGYAETAILEHGQLNGDADLVNKPFRRRELARKVRVALDGATVEVATT